MQKGYQWKAGKLIGKIGIKRVVNFPMTFTKTKNKTFRDAVKDNHCTLISKSIT
jgi:hypothetical protein